MRVFEVVVIMAGVHPAARVRQVVPTLAYLVMALALSFVPVMSIAWVGAPRQVVMVGSVITALLLSGVHLMRRLRPMAVVVAGALVMVGEAATTGTTSAGAVLIECDLVYSCVLIRSSPRSRKLVPIIAAACLVLAVAGIFLAHSLPQVVVQSLTLLLAIGVSLWWGISVRAPMMQVEQERNLRELLAATEVARQREVVVAERL